VVRDIIPYTCIVESCRIPDEMYLTAESLLAHMIDSHSVPRWSCDYCALESPTSDNTECHQFQVFETSADWIVHFTQRHNKENLATTNIATLAELNRRQMFKALSCPLCHELKVDTEAMDYKIDDHILSHLHEYGLLSLPDTSWDTKKTIGSTSQASGLLSHITPIDSNPTLSPRVAEVNPSLIQLQTAMKQSWSLVRSGRSQQIPELLGQNHHFTTTQVELWKSHTSRLKKALDAILSSRQDCVDCKRNQLDCLHADIDMLTGDHKEVENLIEEVNTVNSHTLDVSAIPCESFQINVARRKTGLASNTSIANLSLDSKAQHDLIPTLPRNLSCAPSNDVLEKITKMLLDPINLNDKQKVNIQSRLALVGPKDAGISLLARCFIHELLDAGGHHVFWVNAKTKESIEQAYSLIARQTNTQLGIRTVTELIYYLSWQIETDWIMIFEDIHHDTALYLVSQHRLPQGLRGKLVFTVERQSCLGIMQPLKSYSLPESDWLAECEIEKDLLDSLLDSFQVADVHDPPRHYLPETCFTKMITKWAIEQELAKIEKSPIEQTAKWDRERRSQLATWIRTKAPKVFAITIQCDFEPSLLLLAMAIFQKWGFTDEKLPIDDEPPRQQIFLPQIWNQLKIVNFRENQWKCLAPVFVQQKYRYDLRAQCIFPFTSGGAQPKDGAFSSVYRVTIHKDHHEYPEIQQVC